MKKGTKRCISIVGEGESWERQCGRYQGHGPKKQYCFQHAGLLRHPTPPRACPTCRIKVRRMLNEHRKQSKITCEENCFCWEVETTLLREEES